MAVAAVVSCPDNVAEFLCPKTLRKRVVAFNRLVPMANNKAESLEIGRTMEEMPYISEHLSSLRQEITDLRNLNERCSQKGPRTALDQAALELRTNRLREIKQELSKMLDRPGDPAIWWERFRTSGRTA